MASRYTLQPNAGWEQDATSRPLGVYYRVERSSIVDLQAALNNIGAVYVSANAHDGWDSLLRKRRAAMPTSHASLPIIPRMTDPKSKGGHAFALVGYNKHGFVVQNSWGELWGARGFARAALRGLDQQRHRCVGLCARRPRRGVQSRLGLSRFRVPAGRALDTRARTPQNPNNPADDPWPIDHPYQTPAYQPWSTAKAYQHTLVSGNDGVLLAV